MADSPVAPLDLAPVKNFLTEAFRAHSAGQSVQYLMVVQQIRVKDDPETLYQVLLAMKSLISVLTASPDKFKDLFQSIFSFDFVCELRVSKAFLDLTVNLVSANVLYLSSVLDLFARTFRSIHRIVAAETVSVDKSFVEAIHDTVQKIFRIVPTAHNVFLPILHRQLPHKRFESAVLNDYISQLFRMIDYQPMIQHHVLDMVVERCLEIDVDIVIEDSGDVRLQRDDERDDDPFASDDVFALDPHPGDAGHGHETSHAPHHNKPRIPMEVAELADKLDSLLSLFIGFLDAQLAKKDLEVLRRLQGCLLDIFERRLLSAHKSKFVQFILFHLASRHTPFCYDFARRLLQKSLNPNEAGIIRQSAVMYLASFLSRAQFVPTELVSELVKQLVMWATRYVLQHRAHVVALTDELARGLSALDIFFPQAASLVRVADASQYSIPAHVFVNRVEYDDFGRIVVREHTATQHEAFYAAVQSCCYIVCFYGTDLAANLSRDQLWRQCWEVVVSCRFDPMRYCLRSVRQEFLKLALHMNLLPDAVWEGLSPDLLVLDTEHGDHASVATPVFVWPHVQLTAVSDMATTTTTAAPARSAVLGPNTLESFFPFDPCLLVKVHTIVDGHYRPWKGVPGLPDSAHKPSRHAGPEDEEDEDEEDHDVAMAQSMVSSLACTEDLDDACSLASMSISMSMGTPASLAHPSHVANSLTNSGSKASALGGFVYPPVHGSHSLANYGAAGLLTKQFAGQSPEANRWPDPMLSSATKGALEDSEQEGERDGLEHIPNPELTYQSLHQLAGGNRMTPAGGHRRPRLYSIGSNGSW